jgi:hypothetical protein
LIGALATVSPGEFSVPVFEGEEQPETNTGTMKKKIRYFMTIHLILKTQLVKTGLYFRRRHEQIP